MPSAFFNPSRATSPACAPSFLHSARSSWVPDFNFLVRSTLEGRFQSALVRTDFPSRNTVAPLSQVKTNVASRIPAGTSKRRRRTAADSLPGPSAQIHDGSARREINETPTATTPARRWESAETSRRVRGNILQNNTTTRRGGKSANRRKRKKLGRALWIDKGSFRSHPLSATCDLHSPKPSAPELRVTTKGRSESPDRRSY